MPLKEHDNNIITREHNDPITSYLRNIIQRYFQIENEISQETKEAIIIESYTRLKEIFNAYNTKFVICINERSGNIDLFIRDFGGEEAFEKNNAFNKDFCDFEETVKTLWNNEEENYQHFGKEEADKIVEGNDSRLYDARIPLEHIHTIDEIKGLREIVDLYNVYREGSHLHNNMSVLSKIIYTGSRVSIDLIVLEDLQATVEEAVKRFTETNEYFTTIGQHYLNQLQNIFVPIYKRLQYIESHIEEWLSKIITESRIYTDVKNVSFKNYIYNFLKNYLSVKEYNILKETLEKSIRVISSGEVDVTNNIFKLTNFETICTSTDTGTYLGDDFIIKNGYTNLALNTEHKINISDDNVLNYFTNKKIINGDLKVFLEHTENGINYRNALPHFYQVKNSRHDYILAYYNIDNDNNINICFRRLSYLPVYIQNTLIVKAYTIDKSGKIGDTGSLILSKEDTSNKTNNAIQNNQQIKISDLYNGVYNGNNISFSVQSFKANASDLYNKKALIQWNFSNDQGYSFKLYKRYNGNSGWVDLMSSSTDSVTTLSSLKSLFKNGSIYSINDGIVTQLTDPISKKQVWDINDDGTLTSQINHSIYDILLTDSSYTTYRHRATLTVNEELDNYNDNDFISIVISAITLPNGELHTLSLLVSRTLQNFETYNNVVIGKLKCMLIFDMEMPTEKILAEFSHGGTNDPWNSGTKISFDIRKDKNNVYVYSSKFYKLVGLKAYDESKIKTNPFISISFAQIQAQTGIDFRNGRVGYGNYSQAGATIIGINLQVYDVNINQYIDDIDDLFNPNAPKITGKCISSSESEEIYDVTIDCTDTYEKVEYKFCILSDIDWSVDTPSTVLNKEKTPLFQTNSISITTFSDTYQLHYNSEDYNVISEVDENIVTFETVTPRKKHLTIKKNLRSLEDRLIFCDNTYAHKNNKTGISNFLKDYNSEIATINDDIKDIFFNRILLQDIFEGDLNYHVKTTNPISDSQSYFYDGKIVNIYQDTVDNYFGQFNYGKVGDFLPQAKVFYQLLTVPGKGL